MKVAVIDGQGGGIGKVIVEKLRKAFGEEVDIIALGTNSLAVFMKLVVILLSITATSSGSKLLYLI